MARGAAESILDLIGQTPLLHLSRFAQPPLADVYAKLEWMNPGGSVKDRAALGMILDAEEKGLLKPGATFIEPIPVFPAVGSMIVAPGLSSPFSSASRIMPSAARSLTEPPGFIHSSFA